MLASGLSWKEIELKEKLGSKISHCPSLGPLRGSKYRLPKLNSDFGSW
jgi:hypothetical protein